MLPTDSCLAVRFMGDANYNSKQGFTAAMLHCCQVLSRCYNLYILLESLMNAATD
ncbi:MAG: hypothetical protein ACXVK3_13100 [Candidatus Angelobacter sp.]